MDYSKLTDRELEALCCLADDPYEQMAIAENIRDEKLRHKLMWEANRQRHREEDEP